MNGINTFLSLISHLLLGPFARCPAQVALVFWSVVSGIIMAFVFRLTSNQSALKEVGDHIRAELLAIKLFKEDLSVALACQLSLFKAIMRRLWLSIPPMLVLGMPFLLVLLQLSLWYEHRPLLPGEATIVELQLSQLHWDDHQDVKIQASEGLVVETPPLRDGKLHRIYWRVRPEKDGKATLRWQLDQHVIDKQLQAATQPHKLKPISVRRPGSQILDRLLNPGEPGFNDGSPVDGVVVHYPKRVTKMFGLDVPWWLTFLALSMFAAFAARPWLRVHF